MNTGMKVVAIVVYIPRGRARRPAVNREFHQMAPGDIDGEDDASAAP